VGDTMTSAKDKLVEELACCASARLDGQAYDITCANIRRVLTSDRIAELAFDEMNAYEQGYVRGAAEVNRNLPFFRKMLGGGQAGHNGDSSADERSGDGDTSEAEPAAPLCERCDGVGWFNSWSVRGGFEAVQCDCIFVDPPEGGDNETDMG